MPAQDSPAAWPTEEPIDLRTRVYKFRVDGTRPVLQIEQSSGPGGGESKEIPEKLSIELHTPVSGEIFEARTSMGRLEVDRNGRVMYFSQKGEEVSFTLFVGRSVVVTMSRSTGEVLIQSPSRIMSVTKTANPTSKDFGNAPPTGEVRIALE